MALQFSGQIFRASLLLLILLHLSTNFVASADDEDEGDILNNDEGIGGGGQSSTMEGGNHSADFVSSSSPPPLPLSHSSPLATRLQEHQAQQLFSLAKKFQLVCCMGGVPQLSHPELVRNFTFQSVSYVVDRDGEGGVLEPAGCRLFKGSFLLPQPSLLFGVSVELSYAAHVVCKCPELGMGHALDRSCRRLPNCQNNGFRSLLDPRRCFCLEPFFGEQCQKLCDRGRRMRGTDGRDYCNCVPFFRGDECRQPICLNGGHPLSDGAGGGCECPPHFLGFHCEIDANRSSNIQPKFGRDHHENAFVGAGTSKFHQRFGPEQQGGEMFSRDVSGTVFSLVMIVVLVLSMYMLMKHRMQVQTRCLSNRRADLLGACAFPTSGIGGGQPAAMSTVGTNTGAGMTAALAPGHARRVELFPICGGADQTAAPNAGRTFPPFVRALAPFFGADAGPPPYAPPGQRVRRSRNEVLPPLPSYEDATKLPALRPATLVVEQSGAEEGGAEENGQRQQGEENLAMAPPPQRMGAQIIVGMEGADEAEMAGRNGPTERREEGGGIGTRTLLTTRIAVGGNTNGMMRGEEEDFVMLEMEERGRGGRDDMEDWRRRDDHNNIDEQRQQNVDEDAQRLEMVVAQNANK